MSHNKGFTLIELIIVIVILGILSVAALPRFINLQDDAHESIAKNVFASFTSGVKLYNYCYRTKGVNGFQADPGCYGLAGSENGFPIGNASNLTASNASITGQSCLDIWQGIIEADSNDFTLANHTTANFNNNNDIIYWYAGGTINSTGTYCYYNYIADDPRHGQENWQLRYYPANGTTEVRRTTLG